MARAPAAPVEDEEDFGAGLDDIDGLEGEVELEVDPEAAGDEADGAQAEEAAAQEQVPTSAPAAPRKSMIRSDHELFIERKRTEGTMRDTACKAICKIKHGLRQPGAQEDGRPLLLPDWDEGFKPSLGSYIKFLLSRPDQFRVLEGTGPGFYTIEDVTMNKTVVAPVKGDKGKGKGKGKWKGKGKNGDFKGKGKGFDVKGKGKGKDKGKDMGKDKGKGKETYKGGQQAPFPQATEVAQTGKGKGKAKGAPAKPTPPSAPPTKAAKLLAAAAKEALASTDKAQDPEFEDEFPEEEGVAEEAAEAAEAEEAEADEAEAAEEAAEEEAEAAAEPTEEDIMAELPPLEKEEEEPIVPKSSKHGSYINMLLSGGLLAGGQKRPGAAGLAGAAKRAR